MPKDIQVLLVEDDPYARDLMSMLLTRDWRTRIVAEVGTEEEVSEFFSNPLNRARAIVVDTEVVGDFEWHFRITDHARKSGQNPIILYTATHPNKETLRKIIQGGLQGYLLKQEMGYALAGAIAAAVKQDHWVTTRGVWQMALQERIQLPDRAILLDGTKPVAAFTPREAEIARLAILFNHPHRDLSDELLIRSDQVSKHVSNVYTKLGLDEILSGEVSPEVFIQDKLVLSHFKRILDRVGQTKSIRKTADMATLAFHLLTVPEIKPIL